MDYPWHKDARRLKFNECVSIRKTAEIIRKKYLPELSEQQAYYKVRDYIRSLPQYQEAKALKEKKKYTSVKTKADFENGTHEFVDIIRLKEGENLTPHDIMKFHKLDPEKWEVKQYTTNSYDGQAAGGGTHTMFQSKLLVAPVKDHDITIDTAKRVFAEMASSYKPKDIQYQPKKVPMMLEVNIADFHLGKLAWRGETGEDYDFKIARERYEYVIADVMARTKGREIEKITFPVGHDFFNSDTAADTTTKGTPQNNDLRWPKMYRIGCEIVTDALAALETMAPVDVFYVGSNHCKMMSYFLVTHMGAYFRNDKNINVSESPKGRKYIEYYNTLIGHAHGDEDKKNITKLMPIEAREQYGRTKFHEYHVAHLHTERAGQVKLNDEDGGVIIRTISTICGTDSWHYDNGYVGSVKKAQNFLYDREKGLVDILHSVI